jgi:hypothetical protein
MAETEEKTKTVTLTLNASMVDALKEVGKSMKRMSEQSSNMFVSAAQMEYWSYAILTTLEEVK